MKNKWFLKGIILAMCLILFTAFNLARTQEAFAQYYCKVTKTFSVNYPASIITMSVLAYTTFQIDISILCVNGSTVTLRLLPGTSTSTLSGTVYTHYITADDTTALYTSGSTVFKTFTLPDLETAVPTWFGGSYTYNTTAAGIRQITFQGNDLRVDYIRFRNTGGTQLASEEYATDYTSANLYNTGWYNIAADSGYTGAAYTSGGYLYLIPATTAASTTNPYAYNPYYTGYNPYAYNPYSTGYNPYYTQGYNPYYTQGYNPYYTQGYNTGYNPYYTQGYNTGYNPYYTQGYNTGYNPYYTQGYNTGYNPYYTQGYNTPYSMYSSPYSSMYGMGGLYGGINPMLGGIGALGLNAMNPFGTLGLGMNPFGLGGIGLGMGLGGIGLGGIGLLGGGLGLLGFL